MGTWNSRGLRGSTLEDMINRSNEKYQADGLAVVQKIPTPITPIKISKDTRQITLAYFDQKSTVDYIGVVQGIPICFDAKECATKTFPLANIHEHQIEFMKQFEKQGGISFIIIYFTECDKLFYVPFYDVLRFWNRAKDGGRKSFTFDEINKEFIIRSKSGIMVHYLETIQKDLDARDGYNGY